MQEVNSVVDKAALPAVVSVTHLWGLALPDLVLYLTAIYTVLQIIFLLRDKWWKKRSKA